MLAFLGGGPTEAEAASAPLAADVVVRGPIGLEGAFEASATGATVEVLPPAAPSGDLASDAPVLRLHGASGTLRLVRASRAVLDNPLAGDVRSLPAYDAEVLTLNDATLSVRASDPGLVALLLPAGDAPLRLEARQGAFTWVPSADATRFTAGGGDAYPAPYSYAHEVPAGTLRLATTDAPGLRLRSDAALQVVLDNATLEVADAGGPRTFLLGRTEETQTGLLGTRLLYDRNTTFAVLALEQPVVELGAGARVVYHARAPLVDLDGRLTLPAATGRVRAGAGMADAAQDTVVLEGRLRLAMAPEGEGLAGPGLAPGAAPHGTRLRALGEGSHAQVAGIELVRLPAEVAPAVPLLVGLAAALVAWLSGAAGKGLTLALLPATTGMPPGAVLDHPRRRGIYEAVKGRPGVHLRELQRITGIRWASLQYHTAVLAGAGLVRRTQVGRHTVLSCDIHHLTDAELHALHTLRSARALRVARVLAKGPSSSQPEISSALSLSPRTVNRYLRLLLELRLVEPTGEARRRVRRYAATPRLAELLPQVAAHLGDDAGSADPDVGHSLERSPAGPVP